MGLQSHWNMQWSKTYSLRNIKWVFRCIWGYVNLSCFVSSVCLFTVQWCVSALWDVAHILTLGSCAFTAAVWSTACAVSDCLNTGFVGFSLTWSTKEFIFSEVTSCFKQTRGFNLYIWTKNLIVYTQTFISNSLHNKYYSLLLHFLATVYGHLKETKNLLDIHSLICEAGLKT
jgi:hypothetical protein